MFRIFLMFCEANLLYNSLLYFHHITCLPVPSCFLLNCWLGFQTCRRNLRPQDAWSRANPPDRLWICRYNIQSFIIDMYCIMYRLFVCIYYVRLYVIDSYCMIWYDIVYDLYLKCSFPRKQSHGDWTVSRCLSSLRCCNWKFWDR